MSPPAHTTTATRRLGLGVGWRPELENLIARTDLGFVEAVAENVDARRLPAALLDARERGLQVIPHGIRLSLGGAERPDHARLDHLAILADGLDAPLVSEHIAFVRADGVEAGHVLPVARTARALDILTENVQLAQARLPVPLALEHVAAMVEWPGAEMDEAAFVTELLDRTGALLLLDLSNLYANAHNHGYDAIDALARFPLDRIAYVHVGGGVHRDGMYHDTHADPIVPGVLTLVEELFALTDAPGVLLERDDGFPPEDEILGEVLAIDAAAKRGAARHGAGRAERSRLEAEQAAFVRALIRGDAFPGGLDERKAAAASRSLWRKRMRAVQAAWPALAIGLGGQFAPCFEAFARAVPPPAVGHGFTDGLAFARTLPRDALTDDARVELLLARAEVVTRRAGTFRDRRGLFAGAVSLRAPRRIVVVLRAPPLGRRVLVVPLARGA